MLGFAAGEGDESRITGYNGEAEIAHGLADVHATEQQQRDAGGHAPDGTDAHAANLIGIGNAEQQDEAKQQRKCAQREM
ncbi:hypothetical protein D3C71_1819030 [compost metagenome]